MQVELMKDGSAPLIAFEQRAEEDREATIKAGRLIQKDVDYVIIRTPGSKDTVEKLAAEWLDQCDRDARKNPPRYPPAWAAGHRENYNRWKAGLEIVPEGFSIRSWAGVSKAQAENLIRANVLTVEALACANEDTLAMIGIGGRALKDRAKAWIESSKGNVGEELAALRADVERLKQVVAVKDEKIVELEAALKVDNRKRA